MFDLFKKDAQRWVIPERVADPSLITLPVTLRLLWKHMPLRAMFWFRLGSWFKHKGVPLIPGFTQRYIYRNFGLEISTGANIGGGLYIAHPIGTTLMVNRMGENCSIIANVTIGLRNEYAFPIIGDNVFIGAGARVLGGITIGDNAKIGANAVVTKDIPENATAVGIPARVIRINDKNESPSKSDKGNSASSVLKKVNLG